MTPGPADDARHEARDLMERIVTGAFSSEVKEAAALARSRQQFEVALAAARSAGDERAVAEILDDLGYLAWRGAHDRDGALAHWLDAAARFEALDDRRARVATLLDVAELDVGHPWVAPAVADAVAAGLPADLTGEEDPVRLVIVLREAKQFDAARALAGALVDEALARDDAARAARMLGELGKVQDRQRDRAAARKSFERAVEVAEASGSAAERLRALLNLVDALWSAGSQPRARELFAQAQKIRGVPESLRTLRKIMAMAVK
ncbi:MAG: hypothetical protein H6733_17145 [Alphaproteobacteria bacterium]|nr:hypothetical protein [Alphaproteobacteria bacterium]